MAHEERLTRWTVAPPGGVALAAFLRAHLTGRSWRDVKRLVETGKVFVDGVPERSPGRRLSPGQGVEVRASAPRTPRQGLGLRIVFEDTHVVVVDKPAGVSSVPFAPDDATERAPGPHAAPRSAMDLVRAEWRRERRRPSPLLKVHRIDKPTSGLLVYARTEDARRALYKVFRAHGAERTYLLVAHGQVTSRTLDAPLVKDRGDGLRGVARRPDEGKRAVTHVRAVEALAGATLCEARLETGRTHQIRVHLAEAGHPLVGERVYVRDHQQAGRPLLESPRLLLHAATLGFPHPITGRPLRFEAALPPDFLAVLERLRVSGRAPGGASPAPGRRRRRRG
ncbi:MAG: RluA family pseudouridine synthase [Planctomycetes bacterium]|nr:RluA family pseudouridine synthase [Planctomycetota bacterium]